MSPVWCGGDSGKQGMAVSTLLKQRRQLADSHNWEHDPRVHVRLSGRIVPDFHRAGKTNPMVSQLLAKTLGKFLSKIKKKKRILNFRLF